MLICAKILEYTGARYMDSSEEEETESAAEAAISHDTDTEVSVALLQTHEVT